MLKKEILEFRNHQSFDVDTLTNLLENQFIANEWFLDDDAKHRYYYDISIMELVLSLPEFQMTIPIIDRFVRLRFRTKV